MGLRCDSGAIFYRFSPLQGGLGTSKIIKIHRTVCKFKGFAICSLSRLLTSFWERLGSLLGGFLEPKIAETGSWRPPGPKKNYIDRLLAGPRGILREVFSAPRFLGSPPWAEQAFSGAPGGLQEPPGPLQGSIFGLWDAPKELQGSKKTPWNQAANNSNSSFQWTLFPWSQARRNARSD